MTNLNTSETLGSTPAAQSTDAQFDAQAKAVGKALSKQQKASIRLPEQLGQLECCINGHNFIIRAGETVKVPAAVHELVTAYLDSIGY